MNEVEQGAAWGLAEATQFPGFDPDGSQMATAAIQQAVQMKALTPSATTTTSHNNETVIGNPVTGRDALRPWSLSARPRR